MVFLNVAPGNICMKRSNLFSAGKYEGRDHHQDFREKLSVVFRNYEAVSCFLISPIFMAWDKFRNKPVRGKKIITHTVIEGMLTCKTSSGDLATCMEPSSLKYKYNITKPKCGALFLILNHS